MKIKRITTYVLILYFIVFAFVETYTQEIVVEPSTVHMSSAKFIDFKPGFWAQKGYVFSANIKSNVIDCETSLPKLNGSDSSNELNINFENIIYKKARFSVYPNPFIDQIAIEIDIQENGPLRIDLFNVQGKLVENIINLENTHNGHQVFNVDLYDLEHGMYFLKLNSNGFLYSKKIIK